MSTSISANRQPERKPPPKMLMKAVNPVMRTLLSSPLHGMLSGRLMVLHFRGRKTGNHYAVPVGYAQVGSTLYTGTEARWTRNLRGGVGIEVTFKGQRRPAKADVISGVDALEAAYREIFTASPGYANALTKSGGVTFGPKGEVARADIERASAAGHVVIRTTLTGAR